MIVIKYVHNGYISNISEAYNSCTVLVTDRYGETCIENTENTQ